MLLIKLIHQHCSKKIILFYRKYHSKKKSIKFYMFYKYNGTVKVYLEYWLKYNMRYKDHSVDPGFLTYGI